MSGVQPVALTIWQPWAWAIVHGYKPVENRTWHPPGRHVGRWIAIHAGKQKPTEESLAMVEMLTPELVPEDLTLGAIVGVARLDRAVKEMDSPWFAGPVGWVFSAARKLDTPVPCKGAQGLWHLPQPIAESVREQLRDLARRSRP